MKKIILKYGLTACVLTVALPLIWSFTGSEDYSLSEVIGYLSIGLAMIFVFSRHEKI